MKWPFSTSSRTGLTAPAGKTSTAPGPKDRLARFINWVDHVVAKGRKRRLEPFEIDGFVWQQPDRALENALRWYPLQQRLRRGQREARPGALAERVNDYDTARVEV